VVRPHCKAAAECLDARPMLRFAFPTNEDLDAATLCTSVARLTANTRFIQSQIGRESIGFRAVSLLKPHTRSRATTLASTRDLFARRGVPRPCRCTSDQHDWGISVDAPGARNHRQVHRLGYAAIRQSEKRPVPMATGSETTP
jgi:hypothetical protein